VQLGKPNRNSSDHPPEAGSDVGHEPSTTEVSPPSMDIRHDHRLDIGRVDRPVT